MIKTIAAIWKRLIDRFRHIAAQRRGGGPRFSITSLPGAFNRLLEKIPPLIAVIALWAWRGLANGFGGKRFPRYFWVGVAGVSVICALAAVYMIVTPPTFKTGVTFILPGAGAGTSINLNDVGQASSITSSPFSSSRVDPAESYKRLLLSDRVRKTAIKISGENWLPRPQVKIHDQTQFMNISITGGSPEQVYNRAIAYEQALLSEIDSLRIEEQIAREEGYKAMIAEFEEGVSSTRAALLEHQSATGLASLSQFNEVIALVDNLNTELNNARIDEAEIKKRREALLATLNLSDTDAPQALLLAADPTFVKLATDFAEQEAEFSAIEFKFAAKHPARIKLERERKGLRQQLIARGDLIAALKPKDAMRYARLLASNEYSMLLQRAIEESAGYEAAKQRRESVGETLERERERLKKLSADAARLDELTRAHQVAEAVFLSAMARIDTNKTDLFTSYPLIQTVEKPFKPQKPSSPILGLALTGAIASSILYIMGLALACLRLPILNLLLKRK